MIWELVAKKNILEKVQELFNLAKGNTTLHALFERLDGCDATEAYIILKSLNDKELRTLAALVGQANNKFERSKNTRRNVS